MEKQNLKSKYSKLINILKQNKLKIYLWIALIGTIFQLIFEPNICFFSLALIALGFLGSLGGAPLITLLATKPKIDDRYAELPMFALSRKKNFGDSVCCLLSAIIISITSIIFPFVYWSFAEKSYCSNFLAFAFIALMVFQLILSIFQLLVGVVLRVQFYEQLAKRGNKKAKFALFSLYSFFNHPRKIFWIADIALKGDTEAQYLLSDYYFQLAVLKNLAYLDVAKKQMKLESRRLEQSMQRNKQQKISEEVCRYNKKLHIAQNIINRSNVHMALQLVAHDNIYDEFKYEICCNNIYDARKDIKQAVYWCKQAAKNGFPPAQYNLAICYNTGYGVAKNQEKAVEWWTKAAEQGNADAQYNLGCCYLFGIGVEKNMKKAVEWFTKAAEQNLPDAQFRLGLCYNNGEGVEKDMKKAVEWFTKAAEQGNADAQSNLGCCYLFGEGVEKDMKKAVEWYQKAAEQDNVLAQSSIGFLCATLVHDYEKAVYWYRKAAEQGFAPAQYNLGVYYENGEGVAKDLKKAVEWYTKAAKQGNEDAKEALKRLGVE